MGIFDTGFNLNPGGSSVPLQSSFAGMGDFSNIASSGALDFLKNNPTAGLGGGITSGGPSFMESMIGYTNADGTKVNGWGGASLGLLQGLGSAYTGFELNSRAKDQLAFNKNAFEKNYAANRQSMNTRLEDRQRARVASNAGAYQSVGDYMAKNGIA